MSESRMKVILPFEISVCWSPPLLLLPADETRGPPSGPSASCCWSASLHPANDQDSTTANPTVSTKVVRRIIIASILILGTNSGKYPGHRGTPDDYIQQRLARNNAQRYEAERYCVRKAAPGRIERTARAGGRGLFGAPTPFARAILQGL